MSENGWSEHEKLVMYRLDELTEAVKELTEVQSKTNASVIQLQVKSSLWGGFAGLVTGGLAALAAFLKN